MPANQLRHQLFIGGLPKGLDETVVRSELEVWIGQLHEVAYISEKGVCFATFTFANDVTKALERQENSDKKNHKGEKMTEMTDFRCQLKQMDTSGKPQARAKKLLEEEKRLTHAEKFASAGGGGSTVRVCGDQQVRVSPTQTKTMSIKIENNGPDAATLSSISLLNKPYELRVEKLKTRVIGPHGCSQSIEVTCAQALRARARALPPS